MEQNDLLKIGLAQLAPVWLNRKATLEKVISGINDGGKNDCQLMVFGEALVPGYPFWIERTNGAAFDSPIQKKIHAHYMNQAVQIEAGHLDEVKTACKENNLAIYLGTIECPMDRGGHSLYCSMIYIDQNGKIQSVHRKLQPTYEERLTWSPGDGNGLRVHSLGKFTVGGLNCWENWMPLPRAALYALGEDLHVAIWPGAEYNTKEITRFIARESRSYVISVSGLMRKSDFPENTPHLDKILENCNEILVNGGSCVADPAANWTIEPQCGEEGIYYATISHERVREERQNFDAAGHYSRPDVTQLHVNQDRQTTAIFTDKN